MSSRAASLIATALLALPAAPANAHCIDVFAKPLTLRAEIQKLKAQHKVAVELSSFAHGNQRYGSHPYDYHLEQVRRVLKLFGFGPEDSLLGLQLGTAARLHDILEDTPVTEETLRKLFGDDITSIVARVTNEPRAEGVTKANEDPAAKAARKARTFKKISEDPRAVVLKLADRIANTMETKYDFYRSGASEKLWRKYRKEWTELKEGLGTPPGTEPFWSYLDRLVHDESFVPSPETFDQP